MQSRALTKGRGAGLNTDNRFLKGNFVPEFEDAESFDDHEELNRQTIFTEIFPKSIVNKVTSPDVGMEYSLNPYQGCEHGCIYCYARPTHEYWGYSAGLDFERKILVKHDAPDLLVQLFEKNSWKPATIVLSGNTDCYQPIERKLGITRKLLEVFLKYRHPVGIITKNALILRDLDILKPLAELNLVRVMISITTLNETLRRVLEPRTASVIQKLNTIKTLCEAGIPVGVMMAPVIPSLTDSEILPLSKKVSEAGASSLGYTILRLNGPVAELFENWLKVHYPDRADRILNQTRSIHGGQLGDSRFGSRMSGEGEVASIVKKQFDLARKKYFDKRASTPLNLFLFKRPDKAGDQLSLL